MAIGANERQRSGVPLQDVDGRLIVVGPDGVPISGGAGGGGSDPLSDGSDAGALPTKTLWIAGADGTVLRGVRVDASGRLRTVLEGTPSVSVSNFPGSQPVSGPLTDVQLRASAVPVSGPVTDAQLRAAAVPVSGPLTDTQLRASAVGVSGPLTDTQLRASAVPVSGTVGVNNFPATQPVSLAAVPIVTEKQDQPAGTTATWTSATGLNTALTTNTTGYGTANVSIQVPSTVTGGVITLEVSDDNTVWYPAGAVRVDNALQENVITLALSPGQALNRMYTVSTDAQTQVRARLSTSITGTGNVVVRTTLVAGGIEPFVAVRSRLVPTYGAAYRVAVAASNLWLGPTFVANTDKQLATIYHAATATKIVRIRFFSITLEAAGGSAGTFGFELRQLSATTTPATGAPAIIPRSFDSSDAAAEVTCLALPGTAGSDAAVNSPVSNHFVWSATIGAAVADPSRAGQEIVLHNSRDAFDRKPLTMRAGVAEGFALIGRCSAATSLNYTAYVEFTEEPA